MRKLEVREDESSTGATIATILIGAVAGFAVGMYVAQRVGGFSGLAAKLRPRRKSGETRNPYYEASGEDFQDEDFDDDLDDDSEDEGVVSRDSEVDASTGEESDAPVLEERVLEAFSNDPILAERAIDIGAIGPGDIELEGWVDDDTEAEHAVVIARGVPGVKSVANHLMVDDDGSR